MNEMNKDAYWQLYLEYLMQMLPWEQKTVLERKEDRK